jgi:c-di-GMP-related signal transduction protein
MADAFVGRQAIYDRSLRVHAYELLYREGAASQTASHTNGDLATAKVLLNAFLEIGAERIAGESLCFLNLTKAYITGELPLPLPPERVVVEVLEDVLPTEDVIKGIKRIKEQGVRVALDDYIDREGNEALLELADYVKIDLRAQSREATRDMYHKLRKWDVKLLAEKVETMEEFKFCEELGFEFFQGFFLTQPEVMEGNQVPSSRISLLRMLSRLLDPEVEMEEIEQMISQDAGLAYRLLRHVNSTLYAPRQEITAIQQTLMLLGLKTVRKIVSLIILIDLDDGRGDLLAQSLVRAKMCQSLAELTDHEDPTNFFTAGLLSTVDALTRSPMEETLKYLPLSQNLTGALLKGAGPMGVALACVRAYEQGAWDEVAYGNLSEDQIRSSYLEAIEYSRDVWSSAPGRSAA